MRFLSFLSDGAERVGVRAEPGGDVADLTDAYADMPALLAAGQKGLKAAAEALEGDDLTPAGELKLLPPVPRPPKIICVARNYGKHAEEAGLPVLEHPNLFIRFPRSLLAAGDPIQVPKVSEQVDWEAELAVVIGKPGKHVSQADAYDHVAGYAPFNDVSVRDWQLRVKQFGAGKNFDASGPFGPEIVTRDEVPEPMDLGVGCEVNGEEMQAGNTSEMIFDIPTLVEHVSQFATLEPGDVIATGTPSGVGHFREPPVYLKAGDTVRVSIESVGVLENPVVAEG